MVILILFVIFYYSSVVLFIIKNIEMTIDIIWDIKQGPIFADEILRCIPNIENESQWNQTWAKLEKKYKRHAVYILLNKLIKASNSSNGIKKRIVKIIHKYIFRSFILMWASSLFIPIIFLFRSYIWTYKLFLIISICIISISIVIRTIELLINRIKMGSVDNFHRSIISRTNKAGYPEFMPSQRLILENFYIIFIRNIAATIIGFTGIFCSLYLLNPASFVGIINSNCPFNIWAQFIYFSVVTLTTTGFGDIQAINLSCRLLATLEIGVGLSYIVVLLQSFSITSSYEKPKRLYVGNLPPQAVPPVQAPDRRPPILSMAQEDNEIEAGHSGLMGPGRSE